VDDFRFGLIIAAEFTQREADDAFTRQIDGFASDALLDHSGHVTRGRSRDDTRIDLGEIQRLRGKVGWKPLDMTGRYRRAV
jgi:hypothetical protein